MPIKRLLSIKLKISKKKKEINNLTLLNFINTLKILTDNILNTGEME